MIKELLSALFLQCAPDVSPVTLQAIIDVESASNPFVVANVTDNTSHSFDDEISAIQFLDQLKEQNKKYSAGLMQVYVDNFNSLGVSNSNVFDYCTNIKAGAEILKSCFLKAKKEVGDDEQLALQSALSCYYSGNFTRGFTKEKEGVSYVDRVISKIDDKYLVPSLLKIKDGNVIKKDTHSKQIKEWDVFGDY